MGKSHIGNAINESIKNDDLVECQVLPQRERRRPKYLDDYETEINLTKHDNSEYEVDCLYRVSNIPNSYKEAMESFEANEWMDAMKDEMNSLNENNTFDIVELPKGKPVVGGRWVYAVKLGPKNEEKFKARYVAKGYSQIKDINYKETFAPTANLTSIRM